MKSEKEKMLANIQDLNILLDDMSNRVEQLRTECPSDWSPIGMGGAKAQGNVT